MSDARCLWPAGPPKPAAPADETTRLSFDVPAAVRRELQELAVVHVGGDSEQHVNEMALRIMLRGLSCEADHGFLFLGVEDD
jgi:hypothetical protein